jgi:hypothetical protein
VRRQLGLALLLAGGVLVGCAAPEPAAPGPTAAPTSTTGTALTVVVEDGTTTTSQLTCDPPGGDHPDPAAACTALEQNGEQALPPVPKGRACTQVYGGDQTARVTGTWRGQPVDSRFSLTNGCEISRWTSLAGLLPPSGG